MLIETRVRLDFHYLRKRRIGWDITNEVTSRCELGIWNHLALEVLKCKQGNIWPGMLKEETPVLVATFSVTSCSPQTCLMLKSEKLSVTSLLQLALKYQGSPSSFSLTPDLLFH